MALLKTSESFCTLRYPACNAHAPCWICGLSGCTILFRSISKSYDIL